MAVLVAMTTAEAETKSANAEVEKKSDKNVEATDNNNESGVETAKNKRGLHASLGDYASFGGGHESYAHTDFGHGGSFGGHGGDFGGHGGWHGSFGGHDFGASEHHHEHVKHITVEKKIPV